MRGGIYIVNSMTSEEARESLYCVVTSTTGATVGLCHFRKTSNLYTF